MKQYGIAKLVQPLADDDEFDYMLKGARREAALGIYPALSPGVAYVVKIDEEYPDTEQRARVRAMAALDGSYYSPHEIRIIAFVEEVPRVHQEET